MYHFRDKAHIERLLLFPLWLVMLLVIPVALISRTGYIPLLDLVYAFAAIATPGIGAILAWRNEGIRLRGSYLEVIDWRGRASLIIPYENVDSFGAYGGLGRRNYFAIGAGKEQIKVSGNTTDLANLASELRLRHDSVKALEYPSWGQSHPRPIHFARDVKPLIKVVIAITAFFVFSSPFWQLIGTWAMCAFIASLTPCASWKVWQAIQEGLVAPQNAIEEVIEW